MAASSLAGLALTYYYDNPANQKLMNILKVGLCAFVSHVLSNKPHILAQLHTNQPGTERCSHGQVMTGWHAGRPAAGGPGLGGLQHHAA